jgi:hypothetical protein
MENRTTEWNPVAFYEGLTKRNKLAKAKHFVFCKVSGLQGMVEAVAKMQSTANFVMVADNAAGYTELDNSPHTRRTNTVFIGMRHKLGDMTARATCLSTIKELNRQFLSKLIMEKTLLAENAQYLDPRINLQEAPSALIPGTAVCMFEVAVDTYIDLSYNEKEWDDD